jgi:fructoselysine-6-P-deglycase FrlB-like protein
MDFSLAQKILKSKRTVVLFHTWTVTRELLARAIREKRSMDLDVCVDDSGNAYLGHPKEFHDKTHEPFFNLMPLWEAGVALAGASNSSVSLTLTSAPIA